MHDLKVLKEFLELPNNPKYVFNKFKITKHIFKKGTQPNESFLYIEGKKKNKILFVSHADMINSDKSVVKMENNNFVAYNKLNQRAILGADDRAGCAILYLLIDSGHSILILNGEETGCVGSRFLSTTKYLDIINNHICMIQLDKSGFKEFKTYDVGTVNFENYIKSQTNFKLIPNSSFTDIKILCKSICGANFGIGYYNEHTYFEYINVKEWVKTLKSIRILIKDLEKQEQFKLNKENEKY